MSIFKNSMNIFKYKDKYFLGSNSCVYAQELGEMPLHLRHTLQVCTGRGNNSILFLKGLSEDSFWHKLSDAKLFVETKK